VYAINSTSRHFLLAYDCTTNAVAVDRELAFVTNSAVIWNTKLLMSTSAQNEVLVYSAFNSSASAVRLQKYSVTTSPPYGSQTQASLAMSTNSNGVIDAALFENDFVIFKPQLTNTSFDVAKIPVAFTSASQYTTTATHTLPAGVLQLSTSATSDGTHAYISYLGSESGSLNRLFYTKVKLSNGLVNSANNGVQQQRIISSDGVQNFALANPVFENRSGTISLFYEKETGNPADLFAGVQFGNYTANTKIEIRQSNVSNTGESNWVTVYDSSESIDLRNTIVTIGSTKKDRVQLRFTLSALNGTSAVTTLSDYSVSVPTSNSTGEFYSNTIISDRTIAKINLSADLTLGNGLNGIDGSVSWFASNKNGANGTYYAVNLGQDYLFSTVGNQLKIKAVITIPNGSIGFSPRIQNYSVVAGNIAQQSDLVILNVNLMKTTLQLNTLLTAQRLSWTNMMVDTFQNGDGVTLAGPTLSAGTITGAGTVTSVKEDAEITEVNSVVVVAEYDGTVTFEFSRDNGVNWQPLNVNTLTPLTLGTIKDELKLKATLSAGANLYGWAYLYA